MATMIASSARRGTTPHPWSPCTDGRGGATVLVLRPERRLKRQSDTSSATTSAVVRARALPCEHAFHVLPDRASRGRMSLEDAFHYHSAPCFTAAERIAGPASHSVRENVERSSHALLVTWRDDVDATRVNRPVRRHRGIGVPAWHRAAAVAERDMTQATAVYGWLDVPFERPGPGVRLVLEDQGEIFLRPQRRLLLGEIEGDPVAASFSLSERLGGSAHVCLLSAGRVELVPAGCPMLAAREHSLRQRQSKNREPDSATHGTSDRRPTHRPPRRRGGPGAATRKTSQRSN